MNLLSNEKGNIKRLQLLLNHSKTRKRNHTSDTDSEKLSYLKKSNVPFETPENPYVEICRKRSHILSKEQSALTTRPLRNSSNRTNKKYIDR